MTGEERERLTERLRSSVPFAAHVGLVVDEVEPGRVVFHLDVGEVHTNGAGVVHGGVHATLADSAMAVSLIALGLRPATTQLTLHYLGPVTGGRLVCTGEVVHRGRRSALAEARVRDGSGALLALATASFHLAAPEEGPPGGAGG